MPNYVALLRASFEAEDEVQAVVVTECIRFNAAQDLYPEEGDDVSVIETVEFDAEMTDESLVLQMRRLRNALINTRTKQCLEVAQQLDWVAWLYEHKADPNFAPAGYDYGRFIELTREVLAGRNPET